MTDTRPYRGGSPDLVLAWAVGWLALPAAWLAGARPPGGELAFAALLALLQAATLLRSLRSGALAAYLPTAALGFLAASRVPHPAAAAAIAFVPLAASLRALRARARQRARAALPARIPRTRPVEGAGSRAGSVVQSLVLTTAVLTLAPVLTLAMAALVAAVGRAPEAGAPDTPRTAESRARTSAPAAGASGSPADFAGAFPTRLEWATSAPLEDDTPLVVLRPVSEAAARDGLVHLRGLALQRFTSTGMRAEPATALVDLDERRSPDGWSPCPGERSGSSSDEPREFEVEQVPLRVGAQDASLVFTPTPLLELDCPGARMRPDAEVYAPADAGPLRFRVRCGERRFERATVPERADERAPRATFALPPESAELATIRTRALEVTRGAENDRERVARVLAWFRSGFQYEPEPSGIPGLGGLVDFLQRRAGGCTHYAACAALMLRTLGLPTRVATGFLARRAEDGRLVATPRSGHAWFEVCFEDLGWVACDPTPAGAAGAVALEGGMESGGWWAGLARALGTFLSGEPLAPGRLPALLEWLVLPAAALLLLALVPWALRRRPTRRAARTAASAPARADPSDLVLARLLDALARSGVPRPRTHSLREHARAVVGMRGPALASLEELVERLYRVRFGGAAWSGQDERALEGVLGSLSAAGADSVPLS